MPEPLFSPHLVPYLDSIVPVRPAEMQEMERIAAEESFPIIGAASGHLCYLIAKMINAKKVFELGSGYGYSTAWFAKAVRENGGGEVHHVVWDDELSNRARKHLSALGYEDLIRYQVAEAVGALKEVEGPFDLIFNDIDKQAYPDSLPVIDSKLRSGGVLIIDNMLWGGRIFDPENHEPATEGVREFTRQITTSPNWIVSLAPIRDGVIIAMKR